MLKKAITYEDPFEDKSKTEDFYFSLNKLEIFELEMKHEAEGGIDGVLKSLSAGKKSTIEAWEIFKDLLLTAYGVRGADDSFTKKDDKGRLYRHDFETHPALGELIFEMLKNTELAGRMIEQLFPASAVREAKEAREAEEAGQVVQGAVVLDTAEPVLESTPPVAPAEGEELTDEQILAMDVKQMSPAQLQRAYILRTSKEQ